MKKISFILIFMLAMCDIVFAQQNQSTTIWKVFSSGSCDFETFEVGPVKQDFIDVKQVGNKYYWGNDNVFSLYNKRKYMMGLCHLPPMTLLTNMVKEAFLSINIIVMRIGQQSICFIYAMKGKEWVCIIAQMSPKYNK